MRDHAGERFWLLYNTTEHLEERLAYLAWALVCGVVVVSLLALWLGNRLAAILLRQLEALAQRLDRRSAASLVRLARIASCLAGHAALDDYRQRKHRLIAREREFTAMSATSCVPRSRAFAPVPSCCRRKVAAIVAAGADRAQQWTSWRKRLQGLLFLARGTRARRQWQLWICAG